VKRAAAVVSTAALLLAAGCGGPENRDPRQGRVVIDEENCFVGGCYTNWKVCTGPDLLIHISAADDPTKGERVFEDSPECDPSP
jgi:hypothetical protein